MSDEIKTSVVPEAKPKAKKAAVKPIDKGATPKSEDEKAAAPKAKKVELPEIKTLPELKAWLMKLTPKERQEVEGYVNKILPTLK